VSHHIQIAFALQGKLITRCKAADAVLIGLTMRARIGEAARFELEHSRQRYALSTRPAHNGSPFRPRTQECWACSPESDPCGGWQRRHKGRWPRPTPARSRWP